MRFKGAQAFVCFSFWLRVLDKAVYSAFESTLNSSIVSYSMTDDKDKLDNLQENEAGIA